MAHIETHKVEVAKQLMNPNGATAEDEVVYAADAE
jgi:hypothetical protein